MRRNAGFSLIELLVAVAITIIIVGVSLDALNEAQHASEGVSLMSSMTENLRAGMDQMEHDLVLAGSGIPIGGISIPSGDGLPINQPSPVGNPLTFVGTTIPAVTPGWQEGPVIDGTTKTDMVTVVYADSQTFPPDTVAAPNGEPLSAYIMNDPAAVSPDTPCNGSIDPNGLSATFDPTCVVFNTGNGAVQTGDLIMFSNTLGNTLEYVTSVNGQTMYFAAGDPYGLNGRTNPTGTSGTIYQLQSSAGVYPPTTTATRIWMVTYYIDNTNPAGPRLMRQLNFFPAQPVAESIEGLQVTYNFVSSLACGAACSNQPVPPAGMTADQMMSVNLFLAARSDKAFSWTGKYFRNNLVAQISLRGLAFTDSFD